MIPSSKGIPCYSAYVHEYLLVISCQGELVSSCSTKLIDSRDHVLVIYCIYKALIRPHFEYCAPFWNPPVAHGRWGTEVV